MAYTLLEKGHTISATDFDNNYKHVGQGDLLPRGGTLLETTDGAYDLGFESYKWNDVHVQNLEIQSGGEVQHCMNLIAETTLTATASSIEFTGLNGETDEIYEIICNLKAYATTAARLYLNEDSLTSNYGFQYIFESGAGITAARSLAYNGIYLVVIGYDTTTALYTKAKFTTYANNDPKLFLGKINSNVGDTYIREFWQAGYVWNNTDTLTSMKFTGNFDPGTNIQIWSKR